MKRTSWLSWLLALSASCIVEGQFMYRRPYLPPPLPPPLSSPQIFKKSWAPGPRIPPVGHPMPFGGGMPHKRPLYKPPNYRLRRPPGPLPPPPPPPLPMFNALPSSYKGPPLPPGLGMLGKFGPPPRLPPPKELVPVAKQPPVQQQPQAQLQQQQQQQQFSPEYRPEMMPSLHRGGIDDDKGPIHTIPAPNLGPASAPYQQQQLLASSSRVEERRPAPQQEPAQQADFPAAFGAQESSVTSQRILPSNPTPVSSVHQYEVTESNEISAAPQPYFTHDSDSTQYASSIIQEQQQQQQQQQADASSIQANLQSSMHVTQAEAEQQDAARIYDVLNAFPQQLSEHYALKGQPQMQQHLLQQQLSQILQQQDERAGAKGSFSQPALHSFNYDEQSNKNKQQQQQQQNIFIDQNYASGRVTADYSLAPESSDAAQDINRGDAHDQRDNNIEFEIPVGQVRPTTYFTKVAEEPSGIASQFYSTLPNRDAAEKLAALAAAGNVNSQLIGQLRKQQQQLKGQQSDQSIPANHKEDSQQQQQQPEPEHQSPRPKQSERQRQIEHRQKLFYRTQKLREEQARRKEEKEEKEPQSKEKEHTLRIFVPEEDSQKEKESTRDYEYENDGTEVSEEPESSSEDAGFGSRIVSKKLR